MKVPRNKTYKMWKTFGDQYKIKNYKTKLN